MKGHGCITRLIHGWVKQMNDDTRDEDSQALIDEAKRIFSLAQQVERENRELALQDIKFARSGDQWSEEMRAKRESEGRPVLTINKMPAFIRQVVNDARQNKPQIKVFPVDSGADIKTAEVINGLMRNIERASKADIAYDTAVECAVSGAFGYMRVNLDYAYDDVFDLDIVIDRVDNPFSIYGDPYSTSADGSDWNDAFVVERLSEKEFKRRYGDVAHVDWEHDLWNSEVTDWRNDEGVLIAEWWHREDVQEQIHQLSNGMTVSQTQIETDTDIIQALEAGFLTIVRSREVTRKKVTQRIMTGFEILETNEWPGRFIPIIPVYGDEFNVDGQRKLRSLIHNAVDAQKMHNFWRTTSTELVALAPRVPWIGEEGFADVNPHAWATANTVSHPYLEYSKGKQPPQRMPLDFGPAAGAMQEALMAADDMKSIIGIYDASLGARSNETSGRAIMARQREGDVSTFHFIDNLTRAIRQLGMIILDLIPHVYTEERVVRVVGQDDSVREVKINAQGTEETEEGEVIEAFHDLTTGKYDLVVKAGPSFTTQREETAYQMTEALRNYPMAAPVILPLIAKNSDWPDADKIAERLEAMAPPDPGDIPPQILQQMQVMQQQMQMLAQENEALKADKSIATTEAAIKAYDAETKRMKVEADAETSVIKLSQQAPTPEGVRSNGQATNSYR